MDQKLNLPAKAGNILWDVNLEREFMGTRRTGYSFVIDVHQGIPRLALYHMKTNYSTSTTLDHQPPRNLLYRAVAGGGGSLDADNLYPVNTEVRTWIEENLLAEQAN